MARLRSCVLFVLAVVTCPCHAPLLVVLLAGTTAGAWLVADAGLLVAAMAVVFAARSRRTPPVADPRQRAAEGPR